MTIALGTPAARTGSGTTRSFAIPSVSVGDVLVVILAGDSQTAFTGPAGWAQQAAQMGSGGTPQVRMWTRGVDGSEGSSVSFTVGSATNVIGWLIPVTGADATYPVDRSSGAYAFSTATVAAPSVTTRLANEVALIANMHTAFGSGGPTVSSGVGSPVSAATSGDYGLSVRSLAVASAGSTGAMSNTWSVSGSSSAITAITLRPAGGNIAPSVDVGADATITYNTTYQANATASDPEGPVTYNWSILSKPSGATATFSNATIANPTIKPDKPGAWVLQCAVTDAGTVMTTDSLNLTVQAQMWTRISGTARAAIRRSRKNGAVA